MANASGPAAEGFIAGEFTHEASGVHYKVTQEGGKVWLSYSRENAAADRSMSGREELKYFIGSGRRGRTYLFGKQGYWFEAPINWYGKKKLWDIAPNLQLAREMPMTLAVDPGCLHCHASDVARSLPEARNLYAGEPFAHGGITCGVCHGDARAHVASEGKAYMMNIDRLAPAQRDSVCLNCHLEGETAVVRQGKRIEDFAPGDDLFDYAEYFVYRSENGAGGRATSQWEALSRSECKRKSGERMTCTTCHDPHGTPGPEERVEFYRAKCLQCHAKRGFAERHHPEERDCSGCHMARPSANDIAHEQVTDHWIRRRISNRREVEATSGELAPVSGSAADERDLGLAYASMALRGNQKAGSRALKLLQRAEKAEGGARRDHELHENLGFLEQVNGETGLAAEEYERALAADPFDATAAGDLALIEVKEKRYADAERLWHGIFERDPAEISTGMNLAILECAAGEGDSAMATLERVLEFSPDQEKARGMLLAIEAGRQRCGAK